MAFQAVCDSICEFFAVDPSVLTGNTTLHTDLGLAFEGVEVVLDNALHELDLACMDEDLEALNFARTVGDIATIVDGRAEATSLQQERAATVAWSEWF